MGMSATAQTKIIKLKNKQFNYQPKEYYVAAVVDDRKDTTNFGYMRAGMSGKRVPVNLQGGTAAGLHNYITANVKQSRSAKPIELHLEEFNIEESSTTNGQRVDLNAGIAVYIDGKKINSYSYSAYAQTNLDASPYIATLVTQLHEKMIEDLDGWIKDNKEALTSSFNVTVEMATSSDDEDLIVYDPQQPLTREDFKGEVDELSIAGAVTYSGIQMKYHYETLNNQKKVKIAVYPYFHKAHSWWKSNMATPEMLKHEQLHFDITAIAARKLVTAIMNTALTPDGFAKELEALQKQIEKDRTAMQQQYDKETNHSRNREKQKEWEAKVHALLSESWGS
jgi:hypothetical protein